jgi:hypothetical protein
VLKNQSNKFFKKTGFCPFCVQNQRVRNICIGSEKVRAVAFAAVSGIVFLTTSFSLIFRKIGFFGFFQDLKKRH